MGGGIEQRVATKFCFKASLSMKETLVSVQKAYGNEVVKRSNVFRWYSRFRDGRELLEDDERGGRPKSTRTEVNIADVSDLVKNDRRIASRITAGSLNIPKTVVLRILKEDICSRDVFLLHDNAPAHKAASVCQFLTPKNVTTLYHPPCSPDLSQPDYFLFPKSKMKLKGLHFADGAEIQDAVIDELKKAQKEEFSAAFQKVYDRAKACIFVNGAYFELKKVTCLPHFKKSPKTYGERCVKLDV
jgi:hypothetical protein